MLKRMMRVSMGKQSAKILLSTERAPALSHLWFRQPSRRPTINFHKSISRPTRDFPQPWTLGGRASDNLPLTILLSSFSRFFSPFSLSLAFFPPFLFFLSLTFSPPSILLCFSLYHFIFLLMFFNPFLWKSRQLVIYLSDLKVQASPTLVAIGRFQTWMTYLKQAFHSLPGEI